MKIIITGGCGYVGSELVPFLLNNDHQILVIDNFWFGNNLEDHKNLKILNRDIRELDDIDFRGYEKIIHLANVANDPGVDLDPILSWEVNVLASKKLVEKSIEAGLSQFIYASSGSVYGVKKEKNVTEDLSLLPISVYNKTKMISERLLLSYKDLIKVHLIRPATVCGFSNRMRLDLSVNLLTFQALKNNNIKVHGGSQIRPNIHIKDMVRVYDHFLINGGLESGFYNAGFENISILDIAKKVKEKLNSNIEILKLFDQRSYRQNSDKLKKTGFIPKFNVDYAIDEIIEKCNPKEFIENINCYNVLKMKEILNRNGN